MSKLYAFNITSRSSSPETRKVPIGYDITGRDGYIIAESLIRFIATEQQKPSSLRSWSNLQDARAIFNACCGAGNLAFFADQYPGLTVSLVDEKAPRNHSE